MLRQDPQALAPCAPQGRGARANGHVWQPGRQVGEQTLLTVGPRHAGQRSGRKCSMMKQGCLQLGDNWSRFNPHRRHHATRQHMHTLFA
jgi:hypothetical protein